MIGKLKGIVEISENNQVLLDVNGVCYTVFCSVKTLNRLNSGEYAELLIDTHVREDHIHLYGFYNLEEKHTFTLLQSVKGVGTRMSLAILSELTPEEIHLALSSQDKLLFNNVSGVGKKLAERIITELKDKFITAGTEKILANNQGNGIKQVNNIANDAILALTSLGIGRAEAQNRINNILSASPDISLDDLIRQGLKQ